MQVVLGDPADQPGDLVVLPGRRQHELDERTVVVKAPRWKPPAGNENALAEAYRCAVAVANGRGARSLVLPGILAVGVWPMEDVTRVALTVLMSTPGSAREVTIAVPTAAMLEVWAEALIRQP